MGLLANEYPFEKTWLRQDRETWAQETWVRGMVGTGSEEHVQVAVQLRT